MGEACGEGGFSGVTKTSNHLAIKGNSAVRRLRERGSTSKRAEGWEKTRKKRGGGCQQGHGPFEGRNLPPPEEVEKYRPTRGANKKNYGGKTRFK